MGLTNQFIADMKSQTPEVGMPATFLSFSDRNPGTVAKIISPKKIIVISCEHKAVPKEGGYQYGEDIPQEFLPGTLEEIIEKGNNADVERAYTLRKNGRWVLKGVSMDSTGCTVMLGHREYYYDPHF